MGLLLNTNDGGFGQWWDEHRNALGALGTSIANGRGFSGVASLATQGLQASVPADNAYTTLKKSEAERQKAITDQAALKDKYVKYFSSKNQPDIAQGIADGIIDPATAYWDSIKPAAPVAPYTLGPNDTRFSGDNQLIAQGPEAAATAAAASATPANVPNVTFLDNGQPNPDEQAAFLKTLDPQFANIVKGVANYELDPTRITTLRGDQRQKLIEAVKAYDPSFDMSQFPARSAMRKSITSGTYSQTLNSANLVIQHLDELSKAADGLQNKSGIGTMLNAPSNMWKQATGDPTVTRFNEAKAAVGSELAKVFKGTGVSSEEEIKQWQGIFDAASSPEQIKQAVETAVTLLKSRIDTIQNQYQSAMGKPANFAYLTPHSRDMLNELGIDPTVLDPAATETPPASPADAAIDDLVKKYGL